MTDNSSEIPVTHWEPKWYRITEKLRDRGTATDSAITGPSWKRFREYFEERGDLRTPSHWQNSLIGWIERDQKSVPSQVDKVDVESDDLKKLIDAAVAEAVEGEVAELRSRIRALEIQIDKLTNARE